ncbi:two-component system chemotaxis response regulator CheB [Bacillus pakistanensis]|uniref:Protein-glutamate methylesterase/protein-glutamine glutaminase n=1 Tax=Rossellomorea pakistanensis TaxID=992288 RepID=A0ABS2NG70_9BACI|nr:chemotaxis response regulator protein-glutamate methylesterase [Bacillus pakistanensis]MBM7586852.1 two-component system chemotaxis response regulator CheB [Bacillus pakistanensis]
MRKKKVLIVDDSAFMRKLIKSFLSSSPCLEVIGLARNGKDAIEKIKVFHPDVMTLDVEMPRMNGLEALKIIMEECPIPTIMLSSTTDEGTENTMKAFELGAIDFVAKPSGTISLDLEKVKNDLIEKVENASKVQVSKIKRKYRQQEIQFVNTASMQPRFEKGDKERAKLICIGTSTGGPRALEEVLTALPSSINAPILIVQHMPAGFTKSLAQRLNTISSIEVKEAEAGEIIKKGIAYLAPGGYHLTVEETLEGLKVVLDIKPSRNGHRPSVDILFESVSRLLNIQKVAVIMTGMGSDGTKGLVKLKQKGDSKVIAESQETCIVFGMPKAAIEANVVDHVEKLDNIARSVMKYLP